MTDKKEPMPPEQVACEVCLKEVPRSSAQSAEAKEYVYYFCGANCYAQWRKGDKDQRATTRPE